MNVEYLIIKNNDNFCKEDWQFVSLLETNHNYVINKEKNILKYKKLNINYTIKKIITNQNTEIMFLLNFSIDDENKLLEFEKFDKSFVDFINRLNNHFTFNRLWDDISRKYAEAMYPRIFYIENLLRKIIYYFMGQNVGNNWTEKCFPENVEKSIKSVQEKNDFDDNKNLLYYADFIQLSNLLFMKYPNKVISQNEIIEKLKDKTPNLDELIKEYEFKSNWDRYFQPIVNKEDLEENLNKLYHYRNLVAHNRFIRENDRNNSENLITKIEKILKECLEKIDEIKVPDEDREYLEDISSGILNPYNYEVGINSAFKSTMDSIKLNTEISPAIKAIQNSMKLDLGINPAIKSAMDSIKLNTEISPALKAMQDSMKFNFGISPAVKSAMDSIKLNTEISPAFRTIQDSIKVNLGNNSTLISEIVPKNATSELNSVNKIQKKD